MPLLKDPQSLPTEQQAYVVTSAGNHGSLVETRWKYNRWGPEAVPEVEELYDLKNDPGETRNHVQDAEFRGELRRLRAAFDQKKALATGN